MLKFGNFAFLAKYLSNSFLAQVYFLFQFATRLFILLYSVYNNQVGVIDFIPVLSLGFFFDLLFLFYLIPTLFLFKILFHKIFSQTILKFIYFLLAFWLFWLIIFSSISEVMFWDEFGSRFNFIAVDYLVYTHELIGTIKEEFNIKSIILILVFTSLLCCFISKKIILKRIKSYNFVLEFKLFVASSFLAGFAYFFISTDKINISSNRYFNEAYKNGIYQLFSAFNSNYLDYNTFYPKIDEKTAARIIRGSVLESNSEFLNENSLDENNINRKVKNNRKVKDKYNVVLIIVESLSAEFLGAFGNQDNITPNIDKIAENGILFTNFYSTGTRTVRGIEASILSVPPTPGSSIVRREDMDSMFNFGSVLRKYGYKTNFVYAGNAYFDNLNNFFSSNEYLVTDSNDFSSNEITFSNAWGACDEDLYKKTIKICNEDYESGRNFFSVVLTTSNHRPYTFPENKIDLSTGSRKSAVKYTDYAIMRLIEEAKTKKWFNDTIFIIMADHCASSAGKMSLPIEKYHIPLIIYAPNIVKAQKINTLSSQIDLAPTILDLLGISYKSKFFGKSIFNMTKDDERVFIATYQLLGYIENNYLCILAPMKTPELYDIKSNTSTLIDNEEKLKVVNRAISYYQIAYKLYKERKMKNFFDE